MEREERTGLEFEGRKERRKRHKGKGKKDGLGGDSCLVEVCVDEIGNVVERENCDDKGGAHIDSGGGVCKGKKRKRKRKREKSGGDAVMNNVGDEKAFMDAKDKATGKTKDSSNGSVEAISVEDGEKMKKKKKKKKAKLEKYVDKEDGNIDSVSVEDSKKRKRRGKSENHVNVVDSNGDMKAVNVEYGKKKKEMTKKNIKPEVETNKIVVKDCEKKNASGVKISLSDGLSDENNGLIKGKRFSKQEDKTVREAVLRYIEERGLGGDGLNMVLHCRSHPEVKNHPEVTGCWKVIGEAIPRRHYRCIYHRAHVLFERAEDPTWTSEEYEEVRKFHSEHGADWRTLADKLGKHRKHVKDAWCRLKLQNHRKGPWSQEEYQTLFDLVNKDLLMRAFEEKKTKHGMLRNNISWEAISEKLGTRTNAVCTMKWYNQLVSPLVKQMQWADIDDYRLLDALSKLEASCIEDVDWDGLLEQ